MSDPGFISKSNDDHYDLVVVGQRCSKTERYEKQCPEVDPAGWGNDCYWSLDLTCTQPSCRGLQFICD